jgi:hypothetical protein
MGRTLLSVIVLVAVALAVVFRQREYLRDPLAKVYRNDVQQDGVQVYQSYLGDILIKKDTDPGAYQILVQYWDQVPGTPVDVACIQWLACLTNADHAPIIPLVWTGKGKYDPRLAMTNHEITFVNGDGALMRIDMK